MVDQLRRHDNRYKPSQPNHGQHPRHRDWSVSARLRNLQHLREAKRQPSGDCVFPSRAIAELLGVVATPTRAARRWPLGEGRRLGGGDLAKLRASGLRIVWPGYWDKSQAARAMRPVTEPYLCCRGIFGGRLAANPESPAGSFSPRRMRFPPTASRAPAGCGPP
jgi:hypothetical protein